MVGGVGVGGVGGGGEEIKEEKITMAGMDGVGVVNTKYPAHTDREARNGCFEKLQ